MIANSHENLILTSNSQYNVFVWSVQMEYGSAAVLDFLAHAGERGMLPAGTASALTVGCRTVFEILEPGEAEDLRAVDLDRLITRFVDKRARDFNPSSLTEYGRRVRRSWNLFSAWKRDPANFAPKTRATAAKRAGKRLDRPAAESGGTRTPTAPVPSAVLAVDALELEGAYTSSFPIRRGHVVTISNLPSDLTTVEAERLAAFVKLLGAVG